MPSFNLDSFSKEVMNAADGADSLFAIVVARRPAADGSAYTVITGCQGYLRQSDLLMVGKELKEKWEESFPPVSRGVLQ